MGYFFAVIIILYLLSWCLKLFITAFTGLGNWSIETVRLSREPNSPLYGLPVFFAEILAPFFCLYNFLDRRFRDLFGIHCVLAPLYLLLIYLTAHSDEKNAGSYIFIAVLIVCLLPTLFLTFISEPLGLVRTSYVLAEMARFTYRRGNRTGALFSATKAWMKIKNTQKADKHKKWLLTILAQNPTNSPGRMICSLLLQRNKQSEEQLRGMLQALCFIDYFQCSRRILSNAGLWLAALEADQGNWQAVDKWSSLYLKNGWSAGLFFFNQTARCMLHRKKVGGRIILLFYWCLTLRWRSYFPILQMGLQKSQAQRQKILAAIAQAKSNKTRCLQMLLKISEHDGLREDREILHQMGRSFEIILAHSRNKAADNPVQQQALDEVEQELIHTLSDWNQTAPGRVPEEEQSILIHNREITQHFEAMEGLRANVRSLYNRYESDKPLSSELEWREWAGILIHYQQAGSTENDHYEAYREVRSICWNWSVWLWNEQNEYILAAAVSRWILQEANFFEDIDTVRAMEHNLM